MARCCTISHNPTPPACGQTGTPNFAASSRLARFSFTPATPAGVDLHDVDRLGLEQLLEHDTVGDMLTRRDPDRVHRSADGCRAEDVIGARRLLDPGGFKRGKLAYPADGGWHGPDLVGIERD